VQANGYGMIGIDAFDQIDHFLNPCRTLIRGERPGEEIGFIGKIPHPDGFVIFEHTYNCFQQETLCI
jgi:hypothetical protein